MTSDDITDSRLHGRAPGTGAESGGLHLRRARRRRAHRGDADFERRVETGPVAAPLPNRGRETDRRRDCSGQWTKKGMLVVVEGLDPMREKRSFIEVGIPAKD